MRPTNLADTLQTIRRDATYRQLAAAKLRPEKKLIELLAQLPTERDRQPIVDVFAKHCAAEFSEES